MDLPDHIKEMLESIEDLSETERDFIEQKAYSYLCPEGFNDKNSFVCSTCEKRKPMLYSMHVKFFTHPSGHICIPLKPIGKADLEDPVEANKRVCNHCFDRIVKSLLKACHQHSLRSLEKLEAHVRKRDNERSQRN